MRWAMRLASPLICLPFVGCGSDFTLRGRDEQVQDPSVLTERFEQAPNPKADVLWVVGNSPSMADEQSALAQGFPDFVLALDEAGLSYHLGVVTTDVDDPQAGVLQGDPWIVTPSAEDPAGDFARAVSVGVGGTGPEAGIAAMIAALTEPLASGANRGFRRADAVLHVVVVSDDDDQSGDVLGEDPVTLALQLLSDQAAEGGGSATLSAVVGAPDTGCTGAGGTARPGDLYAELAESSGGAVVDICASDLSEVIAALSALSLHYPAEFPLQAAPYQDKIRVAIDGQRQDTGWRLSSQPPTLIFDEAPAAGAEIEVRYTLTPESSDGEGN